MGRMSDFVIDCGEELMRRKPYLTWDEVMNRITNPTSKVEQDEVNQIKMIIFNRSYNR
ncbi:MAG: hypothetical protein J6U54_17275 [Clostridiales bacterium]|nr:hypothetical protein [Clostridiales bacterium]